MSTRTAQRRPASHVRPPAWAAPHVCIRTPIRRDPDTRCEGGVVVTVGGAIDAANARAFADRVIEHAAPHRRLTLDMTEVTFLAVEGLTALHAVNAALARADVEWDILPSEAVQRVLSICQMSGLLRILPNPATVDRWAPAVPA